MELEHNHLIQALMKKHWLTQEVLPLLRPKSHADQAGLVERLLDYGLTSQVIFEAAQDVASLRGIPPYAEVNLNLIRPPEDPKVTGLLMEREMREHFAAPIFLQGNSLKLAVADPTSERIVDTIKLRSLYDVEVVIAEAEQFEDYIDRLILAENNDASGERTPQVYAAVAKSDVQEEKAQELSEEISEETLEETHADKPREDLESTEAEPFEPTTEESIEEKSIAEESSDKTENNFATEEKNGARITDAAILEPRFLSVEPNAPFNRKNEAEEGHIVEPCADEEEASCEIEEGIEGPETPQFIAVEETSLSEESMEIDAPLMEHTPYSLVADSERSRGVVDYLNEIFIEAIEESASDIHFEPYESHYRIRFRIDGVLSDRFTVPETYWGQLSTRLKVLADLDIAERRRPQDGRMKIAITEEIDESIEAPLEVDARISVMPTIWGEKVVIRILDESRTPLSLEKLGFNSQQLADFTQALERPQGMILVTGPTGSGKTVTLYSALNHLNQSSKNIATAEDPVEIYLDGVNQLQVNPTIGLTFAEALRAFLRQDPDVLMVGEVRDYETADIAIKAAQTGHILLSTLHTNSAPETLTRLLNMGIEPYNIASTVKLIVSQRLVRRLCDCKEEHVVDSAYLESIGFSPKEAASKFYKAAGCDECLDGYRGRIGLFEVMPISTALEEMILAGAKAPEIRAQAEKDGITTLRASGIEKIMQGLTSLDEVLRVTPEP